MVVPLGYTKIRAMGMFPAVGLGHEIAVMAAGVPVTRLSEVPFHWTMSMRGFVASAALTLSVVLGTLSWRLFRLTTRLEDCTCIAPGPACTKPLRIPSTRPVGFWPNSAET